MTVTERIQEIIRNEEIDLNQPGPASIEKMIFLAYEIGKEVATKNIIDQHNKMIKDMKIRALTSRYYKKALDIIGNETTIYSPDYALDVFTTFGGDEADE